jgi:IclR family acetate operon transcriptional repressor
VAVKPLQSLARALSAIDAIAEHQPVGLSALARALDEDKSALQRVLVTLHAAGWIRPVAGELTRWELTSHPAVIATRAQRRSGLLDRARATMDQLREQTGESVVLAVPDAGQIITLDVAESRHLVRAAPPRGMVLPDGGAAALAIFAQLPLDEVRAFGGAVDDPSFVDELARTRARGWSLNAGAVSAAATSIGAAVLDPAGRPVAALVVSAPTERLPRTAHAAIGARVHAASLSLGR